MVGPSSACAASANTMRLRSIVTANGPSVARLHSTPLRMLRRGDVKGRQACPGAPWAIKVEDVAVFAPRKRSAGPVTPNPAQPTFEFQRDKRMRIMAHDC